MEESEARSEELGFKPQQETIYNKLLPYNDKLDAESKQFLADVKTNLGRAVHLRELRPGVFHWTTRLSTYIRLYGRKFSKEDHLHFINLYFELLTIPNLELRLIEKFARTLVTLLKKKNLLTREDLVIPWKPLYQLVERCFYSSYEPLGLEWFPQMMEQDLKNLVKVSRTYFSVDSTAEMMDEFRPLLCPFDETMAKGIGYLELFLPTTLPPEQHHNGFKIWLDELLGIWDSTHNSPIWEVSGVELFARVANDNIGYIDWTPHIPKVFTRFMRGFNLPVGSKRLQIGRMGRGYDTGITSSWIVAMLGHGSPVQEYLDKFFTAIESYFHPSNVGRYSFKLQRMLFKLPSAFIKRLHKERYKKPNWQHPVPEEYKLTDADITAFVESIRSCAFLSMFSKMGHMDAAAALQNLAMVRPELIIPQILEKTYIALDTLIEPHQLVATVSCVVAVARTMLKGGKWLPEGPTHLLPLLNAILPGIDPNDFTKCMVTFQAISTFTAMVPLVDCSEAPLHRDDITEQERDICSATAGFEDFILQFMDRCFTLIEASVIEHTNSQDTSHTKVNQQENMVDVGLSSTFGTILAQCSPHLFETAINRLYSFISNRVFETKVAGKMVANMCRGAAKVNPKVTLKKFVPLCSNKVLSLTEHDDVQLEEELDDVILFNLQILAELVRCASEAVLEYKDTFFKVLHSTLHLTCKKGYELSCLLLRYFLRSLTMVYPREYISIPGGFDKPITEYLPIRDWAKPGDIHNLGMKWHEPSEAGLTVAKEAVDTFMQPQLKQLQDFIKGTVQLSREKLLQTLNIVHNCVLGAGSVMPMWNQPPLTDIAETQVAQGNTKLTLSQSTEVSSTLFANQREEIAVLIHDLLHHMLATGEDDTKALIGIASINNSLLWYRGAIKQEYDSRWKSFSVVKRAMSNKLHGKKQHLRALLIDRVMLQHEQRILECKQTPYSVLHRQILRDLFIMSTSRYSEVRKKGQTVLMWSMDHLTYSNRDTMPLILANLKQDEQISHHQFKGALYLLQGYGLGSLACTHDWPLLKQCWTSLVQAGHSEKPSIMKLLDHLAQKVNKLFDSPSIETEVTDSCVEKAIVLYQSSTNQNVEAPTQEQLADSLSKLQRQNEDNLRTYSSLVTSLVEMVDKGDLRWKFSQMAISFLSLLLRHDAPLPVPAVKLFINSLVHETLVVRKFAIAAVAAIFKQFKRAHTKITIDPYKHAGCSPPTECQPGTRPDNSWCHYDSQNAPKTKDKWEKCTFVDKTHWGYYTWPKSMEVYAPYEDQPKLDRSREELSEGEQVVYDFFTNDAQVSKLIGFLSLEDRKGKDRFNSKRFVLFKGLFRNYGDTFLPTLRPHLEKLASDAQESSQRCLSEIVAALIRGSKHWPFDKVASLWEMLQPILRTVVNQISIETITDWGTAIATSSESTDPRKLHWLFETLMESPIKEGGSFLDASALYVLQGGLMQQEWRVPELLHRLLNYLDPYLTHNYKNVRDRIGSLLTTVFLYDYQVPNGTVTTSPHRKEFVDRILPKLAVLQNPETWATSQGPNGGNGTVDESDAVGSDPIAEERQTAIRLCKTVMKWLMGSLGRMVSAAPAEIFNFLPLVAPLESFESDEELRHEAEMTLSCLAQTFLQPDIVPQVLASVQQIANGNSWRAKCSVMAYLQVMVYNNLFILSSQEDSAETIHDIVLALLKDDRLEVREIAGVTLSGLLHCGFFSMHSKFQGHFETLCKTKLPSKKLRVVSANNFTEDFSLAVVQRHAGILGLSACVQAYPYDVPVWMPQVLMDLTDHLHDPQPIEMTVRKTLSDFRRTHHDNWHQHKQQFTDDQLVVLTDLLVSPCYYA